MDLLYGVVSMVKDMSTIDKQYRNLGLQLRYTLDKSKKLLKKINTVEHSSGLTVFKARIEQGESYIKNLDQLFNSQSIAIKDKLRLSLPLTQTKGQIISVIETLEKLINDLKQDIVSQDVEDNKNAGVKRKIQITQQDPKINILKSEKNQLTAQQIDDQIQQVYQMGPTINQDQYNFSQSKNKLKQIQFTIKVCGPQEMEKILQNQNLLVSKTTIKEGNIPNEKDLYNVARVNFQKCYPKIKAITKDIDRISTKGHFRFIFKKIQLKKNQTANLIVGSDVKRGSKGRSSSSQKNQQQDFFSFPNDQNHHLQFQLIAKKEDSTKTLYVHSGDQWKKVQEDQIKIVNGQKLAVALAPDTKKPTIYFQITYLQIL